MEYLRPPLFVALALGVAALLFSSLHALVQVGHGIVDVSPAIKIEFTRLRRDTEVASTRETKAARERPNLAPSVPEMSFSRAAPDAQSVHMLVPQVDTRGGIGRLAISMGGSDRDVIPLVRINPEYPPRAMSRGIEGWVQVRFTISPAGTVKDAAVVDAEPKGYFEKAALRAIGRWRYNPKVEGGVPVERRGVEVVLVFDLEE